MKEIMIDLKDRSINNFYKKLREQASDVIIKIDYLQRNSCHNGLAILRYPSGTPLKLIEKVNKSLFAKSSLAGCNYIPIPTTHQCSFHLIRNGSTDHIKFEKEQSRTGGIYSHEIVDLGDFLIVQTTNGLIIEGGDFSLYKTKDDFCL